ncbi:uncharacterized protein LOC131629236 [Vicia villosa]|uniref:uncharacterized protein LOC131629236 n=1 Tax=Vicia villosa TaxID=3911 RepID=UPI00273CE235|nr:uncharacterized protein LOC131629236 [Vicia villosa]
MIFHTLSEALKDLVNKAVGLGVYTGLNIRRLCSVDILQFADDTLLIGEGSWNQVWAIKAILRGFEMVSGLGINYHKSKIIGFNVSNNFLDIASNFLSCRREDFMFTFLGIPIGANPRKIPSWKVIVNKIKSRLKDWKAPIAVLKEISRLQSNFLWGGVGDNKKIHWIWRHQSPSGFAQHQGYIEDKFVENCSVTIGNGFNTSFWHSRWMGNHCLKDSFPEAFALSALKFVSVATMGGWSGEEWHWGNFGLDLQGCPASAFEAQRLHSLLLSIQPAAAVRDSAVWCPDPAGGFSVRGCYALTDCFHVPLGLEKEFSHVLKLIWKTVVPQKVKAFGWRCCINRLPTKDLLQVRAFGSGLVFANLKKLIPEGKGQFGWQLRGLFGSSGMESFSGTFCGMC